MPWVPFEESALSAAWEFADFGTDAYLHGSSVQVNSGIGRWAFNTYGTPGRVRISVVSYSTSSANAAPANFNYGMVQNEGGQFEWQPEVFELEISGGMSQLIYAPSSVDGSRQVETYHFLIEVWEEAGLVANDDEATTSANTPVTVPVLANDTYNDEPVTLEDLAGPPTIVSPPSVGEASVNPDGSITYTPPDGFTGEVEFQYRIATPEPEPCAWVSPFWHNSAIYPEDYMGDLPSWFVQGEGFDLLWQGNENYWWWDSDEGRYLPADGPTPEWCEEFVGTLRQDGNEVCVTIYTECPA